MRKKYKLPFYFLCGICFIWSVIIFARRFPSELCHSSKSQVSNTLEDHREMGDPMVLSKDTLTTHTSYEMNLTISKHRKRHRTESFVNTLRLKTPLLTKTKCVKRYKLLIMVTSKPDNFERRLSIRSTWATRWHNRTDLPPWRTVFQLGKSSDPLVRKRTTREAANYQDMIFGDFTDTFYKLPIKVIMAFEWATKFCDFEYLLKSDDDVFVHVPNIFAFLSMQDIPRTRLYAGRVQFNNEPVRSTNEERIKKYVVTTKEYPYRTYPRFCSGAGMMLSRDFAADLVKIHDNNNYFKLDDVYIGMLALRLGVDAHHDKMFRLTDDVSDCKGEEGIIVKHGAERCMTKLYNSGNTIESHFLHIIFVSIVCYCLSFDRYVCN